MSVLLGLCDSQISPDDQKKLSATTNKIGGSPVKFDPRLTDPSCHQCGELMTLIVQITCPLDNSAYQRTLYIFSCPRKSCQNLSRSWRVFRCQRRDDTYHADRHKSEPDTKPNVFETTEWCDDADDWGDDDNDEANEASKSDTLSEASNGGDSVSAEDNEEILEEDQCITEDISLPKDTSIQSVLKFKHNVAAEETSSSSDAPYEAFYMSAFEEPSESGVDNHVNDLLKDYERREGTVKLESDSSRSTGEKYEKSSVAGADSLIRKFMKRVSRCPEQCLRYSWQGDPLPMSPIAEKVSPCQHCHSPRVFELQLMPALITYLKKTDASQAQADFGTVMVYSCKGSCWTEADVYREELAIVQPDPDNELFQ